jgi:hypothetical protein
VTDDNQQFCITHWVDDLRPCFKKVHYADCANPETCTGCVPREAQDGFVCGPCSSDIARAIRDWTEFVALLGGEARAVTPEPGGGTSKPGSRLPLSPLQLTFDVVRRHEASRPSVDRLWVHTPEGAADAVRFAREVRRAVFNFPTSELDRKIRSSRCPSCGILSLVYEPVQTVGGDAFVKCLNDGCGNIMDHTAFERLALMEAQCCRRCRSEDGCTNTACKCHLFAPVPEWQRTSKGDVEPFDPSNPEHAALVEVE